MEKSNAIRSFEIIASILIAAAMAAVAFYEAQAMNDGRFAWEPYLAFAVFVAGVFLAYGAMNKGARE